jgi:competence protein ComEC
VRWPAAIPAVTLAIGIAAGIVLPPLAFSRQALVPLAFLVAATVAFIARRDRETVAGLACGFICAGFALGQVADSSTRRTPLREVFDRHLANGEHQLFATIAGRLRRDAVIGASSVTLDLSIDRLDLGGGRHNASGGALIGVGGSPSTAHVEQWRAGRHVSLPVSLRLPTYYRNAGVADAVQSLERRGSSLVGSVKSAHLVEIRSPGSFWAEAGSSTRAAIRRAIGTTVAPWSDRSAAVVTAILIGDRAGLSDNVELRLQEAGTYHVIAISGGNIAIFGGLCLALFRLARAGIATAPVLTIVVLTAYAGVVEGGSSVGRATLMAALYLAVQAWDHRSDPLNIAALSASIMVCFNPLQLTDAGLWLTFGATIAIVLGAAALAKDFSLSRWFRAPLAIVAATACAEAVLFPICAYVFSRITAAGLVANLAAIPLMTVVQLTGMTAIGLAPIAPGAAAHAGWVAHLAVEGLIGSATVVDWVPWLTRRVPPPAIPVMCAYYAALVLAITLRKRAVASRLRTTAIVAAVASALWIVVAPVIPVANSARPLRVTFLDVGQGDAAIVQFPNGRTLSIDAGGLASTSFDIASRVIAPALWTLGVRRIDYMTITHGDVDHIGGAVSLFRDFAPAEVWDGVPVPPHRATQELRALAARRGTVWRTVQPADRVMFDAVELLVHHPPHPDWERQRVRNDDSQVIEIRYHGVSFVFTGDIGRDPETRIAHSFAPAAVRIVKVPHHGSATSSSEPFIDALRPDIAVISAGRGNPFGHPAPRVVQRYREAGAAIYRTDLDGSVTVETDGTTTRVRTFTGRRLTLTAKTR